MKTKLLLSILTFGSIISAYSQNKLELSFAAANNGQKVPLDSIFIENLTQGGDTMLFAPDTLLVLDIITGFGNNQTSGYSSFTVSRNYPNPFKDQTSVDLKLTEKEQIEINIRDIFGRELLRYKHTLNRGNHSFTIHAGSEQYYLLTVIGKNTSKTIKMISVNDNKMNERKCKIDYTGNKGNTSGFKSQESLISFVFVFGDTLRYTGFAQTMDGVTGSNEIADSPSVNTNYEFDIIKGIRCPGAPTVADIDGNLYNTVQIINHCWMAENLITTTYDNGTPIPNVTDGSSWQALTTGAYVWYDNEIIWKDQYGAMYNWYAGHSPNGLCPEGWHVPTYDDWTSFVVHIGGEESPHGNELKSCRQMNSPLLGECNTSDHPRWDQNDTNYGNDKYGFSGLPGGFRALVGNSVGFHNLGISVGYWTSTDTAFYGGFYGLVVGTGTVHGAYIDKRNGLSVRCLKD